MSYSAAESGDTEGGGTNASRVARERVSRCSFGIFLAFNGLKIGTDHTVNRHVFNPKGTALDLDMAQQQVAKLFFFFFAPHPLQLHVCSAEKSFLASKYSCSRRDGSIPASNLNRKVWGFCLFVFLSCFFLLSVCGSQNVPVDKQGCVFSPPRCSLPSTLAE